MSHSEPPTTEQLQEWSRDAAERYWHDFCDECVENPEVVRHQREASLIFCSGFAAGVEYGVDMARRFGNKLNAKMFVGSVDEDGNFKEDPDA